LIRKPPPRLWYRQRRQRVVDLAAGFCDRESKNGVFLEQLRGQRRAQVRRRIDEHFVDELVVNLENLRHRGIGDTQTDLRFERKARRKSGSTASRWNGRLQHAGALEGRDRARRIAALLIVSDCLWRDLGLDDLIERRQQRVLARGQAVRRKCLAKKRLRALEFLFCHHTGSARKDEGSISRWTS
jgi:hypothetical protein